jgi:2'-5' RNA ligase
MRGFVAVEVPEEVRAAAARMQERLREAGADVRWVDPAAMHVTLKFLGEVPGERIDRLRPLLAEAARGCGPVGVEAVGAGNFPGVVWAGIRGNLVPMAAAVERAAAEIGVPSERRPYRAHLTLGRVKGSRGEAALAEAIRREGTELLGTFEVRGWTLFRALLRPGGAVYEPVERWPLTGG